MFFIECDTDWLDFRCIVHTSWFDFDVRKEIAEKMVLNNGCVFDIWSFPARCKHGFSWIELFVNGYFELPECGDVWKVK